MNTSEFTISKNAVLIFLSLLVVTISGVTVMFASTPMQNAIDREADIYFTRPTVDTGSYAYNGCLSSCKNELGISGTNQSGTGRTQLIDAMKNCMATCFNNQVSTKASENPQVLARLGLSQEQATQLVTQATQCMSTCETQTQTGTMRSCTQACRTEVENAAAGMGITLPTGGSRGGGFGGGVGGGQTNPIQQCAQSCTSQGTDISACIQNCFSQRPLPSNFPGANPIVPIPTVSPY